VFFCIRSFNILLKNFTHSAQWHSTEPFCNILLCRMLQCWMSFCKMLKCCYVYFWSAKCHGTLKQFSFIMILSAINSSAGTDRLIWNVKSLVHIKLPQN
jgi:hypothetical protein